MRLSRAAAAMAAMLAAGAVAAAAPPQSKAVVTLLTASGPEQVALFEHADKTGVAAAVIHRGGHVLPLPRAARQIDPRFQIDGKTYDVAAYMKAWRVSGVMAVKDGKVILERYGLGRAADDRWISFSVAKSVTSTLIGAAIKDGYIKSLDDPVTRYIPQLAGSAYDVVSIRDLITMTSGVKWNEDYRDPNSDVARVGLTQLEPGVNPVVAYMRRLPRAFPPGAHFAYDTGETDLAGILVSDAVGKPMAQYLSEKIWAPFGMAADAFWLEDIAGHERGGCCIYMRLSDYARFGLFMLGGGKAGGRPVLPEAWIADATAAHVAHADGPVGYGYFWWIYPDHFEAEGVFGQAIAVFPKEQLVVVINSAWPHADDETDWAAQYSFLEAVAAASRAGR
ncbi:MAG TPA: serine hydrolase [Caulobacteraceae bacterium]|nr:serine hydrolase [Caulobacteraceae bacterium]